MEVTALAPWFGSKRNLASTIATELGQHKAYWEPFCGSMAVLLAKPTSSMETVNDLHRDLINLARVIQHQTLGPRLYRHLRRVLCAETEKQQAAADLGYSKPSDSPDLGRAAAYFLDSWLGRNGSAGSTSGNNFCRRFTANGGSPAKRLQSTVESIPAWRRRLRNVIVLNTDALELLERIDDVPGTAIYCDPPYLVKGSKYQHDFAAADHKRLAELLKRFKHARVVVSYYAHPDLKALYPGWTQRQIVVSKASAHQGQRGANDVKAVEVLLLNGPSYATDGKLF